jgi:hypothetical protein
LPDKSRVKYWEIIADNLSNAGWSWGCVSAIDSNGRTIFIADAHCDDGNRFIVRRMLGIDPRCWILDAAPTSGAIPRRHENDSLAELTYEKH